MFFEGKGAQEQLREVIEAQFQCRYVLWILRGGKLLRAFGASLGDSLDLVGDMPFATNIRRSVASSFFLCVWWCAVIGSKRFRNFFGDVHDVLCVFFDPLAVWAFFFSRVLREL